IAGLRGDGGAATRLAAATDPAVAELLEAHPPRSRTRSPRLRIRVDRPRALYGAWYELFPRSEGATETSSGTLRQAAERLPAIAGMGFDVVYLPPIHPIGFTNRKGRNNSLAPRRDDPGSPWAIGGEEGGHTAVHPDLGTLEDFRRLVARARELGLDIALDFAIQCSPDHPWLKEHPEWFHHRPDGTLKYAENPPKRYQDIYNVNWETEDRQGLWEAIRDVVFHWMSHGVTVFRVDNPHTKPFAFWEWVIDDLKRRAPETIFLSEAFTRPRVLYRLAKLGFTQSYTYFAWRRDRAELTEYFTELTASEVREFCRPNLWPNTPDILTEELQQGGRAAFVARLVLAATLGASYGIYGPVYELCEARAVRPGSEEYLDSEKYQLRHWDLDRPDSLADLIARVNRIRRQNAALQADWSLRFHGTDNDRLLCYSKATADGSNAILVVVNLDHQHPQSGWTALWMEALGLEEGAEFQVHDLISEGRYRWRGPHNFVRLDPAVMPAHVFRIRRRTRTERDFEYFM
ncbi:MAG TPA: alpha-amylase family glycosyl hydrolase, partial [Actinomycetota bacterium]|nr:alpha-amylase family glycosyl hydrolase [Actinomycetota bacterium]